MDCAAAQLATCSFQRQQVRSPVVTHSPLYSTDKSDCISECDKIPTHTTRQKSSARSLNTKKSRLSNSASTSYLSFTTSTGASSTHMLRAWHFDTDICLSSMILALISGKSSYPTPSTHADVIIFQYRINKRRNELMTCTIWLTVSIDVSAIPRLWWYTCNGYACIGLAILVNWLFDVLINGI